MSGPRPQGGLLVTLDGVGGAGKTTTAGHLTRLLAACGYQVHPTTQPSRAQLGQIARGSDLYRGRVLACLVAADRYHQQDSEIRPALAAGRIVVCDRYVASSYVLQRMDGVDIEFIQAINAHVDRPDLAVILTADPATATARIDTRGTRHRFETGVAASAQEAELYADTAGRLADMGWPLLTINTNTRPSEQVAVQIAARIAELMRGPTTGTATA
jgi:dTMP kinase